MLRGAIWDLDGTILDSMSAWDHVGENYLRSQRIEPEPDLDEAIATMSLHQAADYFIEHYGVKQTRDELIKSAVAIVDDFYRYEAQLKPHLKEFLAQLHETGVKCVSPLLQSAPSWKLPWHVAECLIISAKSLPAPLWVPERTNQPFIGKP